MSDENIDIAELAAQLDSEGMLSHLRRFANDLDAQWSIDAPSRKQPPHLVCMGMGGSAAAADFIAELADMNGAVGVTAHRGYDLPNWASDDALYVAVSYSGNTEETLSSTDLAIGWQHDVITISSGGKLAEMGGNHISIPAGQPPRSAFGHLFGALSRIADSAGVIDSLDSKNDSQLIERLNSAIEELDFINNPESMALAVARTLQGRQIGIISADGLACAGTRFVNQLNENSGVFARPSSLPEMNHNEVIAWSDSEQISSQAMILLTWDGMHERVSKRIDWMTENLNCDVIWNIHCEGESQLEALLYSCIAMDWISCALALLRGKDPSAIGAISSLKEHLSN